MYVPVVQREGSSLNGLHLLVYNIIRQRQNITRFLDLNFG